MGVRVRLPRSYGWAPLIRVRVRVRVNPAVMGGLLCKVVQPSAGVTLTLTLTLTLSMLPVKVIAA